MSSESPAVHGEDRRRPAARARVDVAAVQDRLHPRAAAGHRGGRRHLAGRGAGCVVRALAQAAGRRARRPATGGGLRRARGDGRVGDAQLAAPGRRRPADPALPRPGDRRPGDARRHPAGLGHRSRAAGAARLPRPSRRAAQSGVRAGPHVHVAARHHRLDRPGRADHGPAGHHPPSADPAGRVRHPHRDQLGLAAGGGAAGGGTLRRAQPARRAPVRHRDQRRGGQGGPGHRDRARSGSAPAYGMVPLVRPGRGRPVDHRHLPRGRLGDLRSGLRRRGGLRRGRPAGLGGIVAAHSRGRGPAVLLRRRHHGRDRLPPRCLARRFPAPGLAGGVRRRAGGRFRCRGPRPPPGRHPAGSRQLRLPGDGPAGAGGRHPPAAARRGGRGGRRERGRQIDPGEAAGPDVRADGREDLGRRSAVGADAGRGMAAADRRRVPGLLPVRVQRPAQCRAGRPAPPGRRAGRHRGRGPGRGDRRDHPAAGRSRTASSARPGRTVRSSASASGRSWPCPGATCAISRC